MSRYIDADALTKEIKQDIADNGLTERYVFYRINDAPSIDIVRCAECIWRDKDNQGEDYCTYVKGLADINEDSFCSYGEREGE